MKTFKIKLLYYIGHITYLIGMRYWYIPGSYTLYGWAMSKSSELDTDNILWKPARTEKDDL